MEAKRNEKKLRRRDGRNLKRRRNKNILYYIMDLIDAARNGDIQLVH